MKGDSRGLAKQIVWSAMSRGILTHGDSLRAFERGGVGRAVRSMSGRHRIAAFPGDLAFGAGSRGFASVDNNSLRRAMDRTTARGDLRRHHGATATILKPDLLDKLRLRLREPPPDGGLWSSRKVAAWMAGELGLVSVAPQRGWEALKAISWSIQKPRPKNPKSATPEEAAAFKKSSRMPLPRRRRSIPANPSRSSPRTSTASA
jgi:hypothetical protein